MHIVYSKTTGDVISQTDDLEYLSEIGVMVDIGIIHNPFSTDSVEIYQDSGTSFSARIKLPEPIPKAEIK